MTMNNEKYPVNRLDRNEFAVALRKGQGRALSHVKEYGLDEVADLVLEACLHNQLYDTQCESGRAGWLYAMFGGSPYAPRFREAILENMKTETEGMDLNQLCDLAQEMAAHGDPLARERFRERVRELAGRPDTDWSGIHAWLELDGNEALLELARIYGRRLLINPDEEVPDYLLTATKSEQAARDLLRRVSSEEPAIKAYWDFLEKKGVFAPQVPVDKETAKQQRHEKVRQQLSLEDTLQKAKNKFGKYPSFYYMGFGQHATPGELEEIYRRLMMETDEEVQVRLLWVFRRAPLPRINELFLLWAGGCNDALKEASLYALSQISDPRIHALARAKVKEGRLRGEDCKTLHLFLNNYQPEDAPLIMTALGAIEPNPDEAHSLGLDLINLSERHGDGGLAPALRWVYENTPCSKCRHGAIEQLDRLNQLPDDVVYECLFDGDEEIRAFAKQKRPGTISGSEG